MPIKCFLFGHKVETIEVIPVFDMGLDEKGAEKDYALHRLVCDRCLKVLGQRKHYIHEPKSKIEEWLHNTLPYRQRRRMYKIIKREK